LLFFLAKYFCDRFIIALFAVENNQLINILSP
jgi:hypothetical protein